ncbi:BTAD domain-containing putative transcriptional regulator [Actinoplanes sp. NBRC 101535]|uniref:AfsR/SARP family transcriptional regulator n=1 Tax=Actinoplanes sp. NBRC 101535 TaxID=3032196 RepID=UPI0024A3E7F8|nr:BTAD domain-containing putative transcriptional regulator [Actinoplanes sp. NBRC 101535]GLY02358.1 XRE family transcriptional regulator [Actinoplanes sp. NBRC 101535]
MDLLPGLWVEGFGPLRAYACGAEIDLGPPKQRAVFALLAHGGAGMVSRAEIVDGVWGESPPSTAAGSVHTYVSGLRRVLGPAKGLLIADRNGYGLRIHRDLFDITRAEDLAVRARASRALGAYEQALEQWPAGPVLTGVPGPHAARERSRLTGLRLQVLIEYAELAPQDRLPEVAGQLLAEVSGHPLDERLCGVLMSVLHRVGRTGDALALYGALRRRLVAELGIGPSPALQAVHGAILADDRGDVGDPPPSAAVTVGGPVRPAQLPPGSDLFVGRADEMLAVVRAAAGDVTSRCRTVLVAGVGGIGKTALAVRAAQLVRDSYPDGQLYLDLRGFDPDRAALTPDAALRHLLTSVGAPRIPASRTGRVALWRSMTVGRRLLLVLDDAACAAQVEDLLPGGDSCFTVVTSRGRLSSLAVHHAARRITLGPLAERDAVELLTVALGAYRVRTDPEAARRLSVLCGYSPMALMIAVERVSSAPEGELGAAVAEGPGRLDTLQVAGEPLLSVRRSLAGTVVVLDDAAGRAFRLLGVFPGPALTAGAAAALFGTGPEEGGVLLDRLIELCLLERRDQWFGADELTRAYAGELAAELPEPERRAALSRVLDWYRAMLTRGDERDLRDWCAAEWRNLTALITAAEQAALHAAAWRLAGLMTGQFIAVGRPLEWLDLLRVALRAAEADGDRAARAVLLGFRATAYCRLGQSGVAIPQMQAALDLLTEPGDRRNRITVLLLMGGTLRRAGRYDDALVRATEAGELARAGGDDQSQARALALLCQLHADTGRWAEALRHGGTGMAYARRAGSPMLVTRLHLGLALAHSGLGQAGEAERSYREAARISQGAGDRFHEARALFGLARLAVGEPVSASVLARRALARFEDLDVGEANEVRLFLAGCET